MMEKATTPEPTNEDERSHKNILLLLCVYVWIQQQQEQDMQSSNKKLLQTSLGGTFDAFLMASVSEI
jgi:hypothetical protein